MNIISEYARRYFCNDSYTELSQMIAGFALGLIFGPFSKGIAYFLLFILVYEIALFYYTQDVTPSWRMEARFAISVGSLLGWIIGRWLILRVSIISDLF
jgi:hypothetical protein